MEIIEAIKKPFSDWGKLAIGSVLGLIPIANFAVMGYGLQNVKSPKKLPEFSWETFVMGLKCLGVGIVYSLLTFLVMLPFIFGAIGPIVNMIITQTLDVAALMSMFGVLAVGLLVGVLSLPANIGARLRLGRTESLSEALKVFEVLKYSYNWKFVKHVLLALLVGIPIAFVGGLIPVVGFAVANYVMMVFMWSYIGENAPKL